MKAIKIINGLGHDQILNLSLISSVEIPSSNTGLTLWFGKDHMQITLRNREERDELFQKICVAYEVDSVV